MIDGQENLNLMQIATLIDEAVEALTPRLFAAQKEPNGEYTNQDILEMSLKAQAAHQYQQNLVLG